MSMAAFDQLKKTTRVSRDQELNAQLKRVGERLARVVFWDMPDADWEFVVFDDPNINAFAMAGGKVGVYTGLFRIVKTDDELAGVLAHEISHVTAKHVDERLSHEMGTETLGNIGGTAMGMTSVTGALTAPLILGVYGMGANSQLLAWDREHEKEADYMGMIYMARAGYDPQACVRVLERLEEADSADPSRVGPAPWESTHPPTPDRIQNLQERMPEAQKVLAQSAVKAAPIIVK